MPYKNCFIFNTFMNEYHVHCTVCNDGYYLSTSFSHKYNTIKNINGHNYYFYYDCTQCPVGCLLCYFVQL